MKSILVLLAGVVLVVLALSVSAVSNATGQTVALNGSDCVSFSVNDTVVGTACSSIPNYNSVEQLSYGGNLASPKTSYSISGVTVNAPAFPAVNQNVSLTGGQSFYPDDSRFNFKVSCTSNNVTNTVFVNNTVQVCAPVNVSQNLNPGEEYFNAELNIRVKAPQSSDFEKDLKPGETFTKSNLCYGNLTLYAPSLQNASQTPTATPTAQPTLSVTCGSGTHYENGACVPDKQLETTPMAFGFPILDLLIVLLVGLAVANKFGILNQIKKKEDN